jgi:membrane dipeptidase
VVETLSQLDVIHRLQAAYPEHFTPAEIDSHKARKAFERKQKFLSPIGLEGLHMIGRNASTLRMYHKLGVKYATLTWNCHNAFADAAQLNLGDDPLAPEAAQPAKPYWGGLSPLGVKMIREMNRLGVIVSLDPGQGFETPLTSS